MAAGTLIVLAVLPGRRAAGEQEPKAPETSRDEEHADSV